MSYEQFKRSGENSHPKCSYSGSQSPALFIIRMIGVDVDGTFIDEILVDSETG